VIRDGLLGHAYALAGRQADARKILAALERPTPRQSAPSFQIAQVYIGLGDHDRAMEWLEKAYAERSPWLSWLKVEPTVDPLRSDPRFKDLLRRIGF
jgi:tetratricopeptide (TPR) repeat protein